MTDTPAVHGTPEPGGIKGFMKTDTAGMPNWVWLLVIAGGIGLALGIKYYTSKKTPSSTTGADTSGLGLAIDPTTGLPYAVEGLVPAGGVVGSPGSPIPPQPSPSPWKVPTLPTGDILWKGTAGTDRIWYGTSKSNQHLFNSLFPTGTTFRLSGRDIFYTVPGGTEAKYTQQLAPHTPGGTPPPGSGGHSGGGPGMMLAPQELLTSWPGDTSQVRIG